MNAQDAENRYNLNTIIFNRINIYDGADNDVRHQVLSF